MLRLFTALTLPPDVGETLQRRQSGLPGARWRPLEALHVTLAFYGEMHERRADDLAKCERECRNRATLCSYMYSEPIFLLGRRSCGPQNFHFWRGGGSARSQQTVCSNPGESRRAASGVLTPVGSEA
jgi:hypothetical protein